ncbi:hypothetical protein TWF730_007231 [Orbilia blumenaviensis]|uniref:FAD dependent oxidoreductase domain-containing protein n=1 Tax=Orbilia blumenaviensis TaxID=1796055 RepID=A0AAV9V9I4_9PEZI
MSQNTTLDNTTTTTTATTTATTNPSVLILGAGVIGLSTAYYLSSPHSNNDDFAPSKISPRDITVLDTSPTLFACASGRAGGFLAKDWFGAASSKLGELSFSLHRQLADANDGRRRWGYAPSRSYSFERGTGEGGRKRGDDWLREGTSRVDAAAASSSSTSSSASAFTSDGDDGRRGNALPDGWWNCEGGTVELSSTGDSTAQLDPHALCEFLLEEIKRRGVTVRHPVTPVRISQSADGQLGGLVISHKKKKNKSGIADATDATDGSIEEEEEEEVLPCSHILIAAGSWSSRLFQRLFPGSNYTLPVSSLAGHSIILRTPAYRPINDNNSNNNNIYQSSSDITLGYNSNQHQHDTLHAVFAGIDGLDWHPEAFTRANGDIYLAGINSSTIPLPELATDVKADDAEIQRLIAAARELIVQFSSGTGGCGGGGNNDNSIGKEDEDGTRNDLTDGEANVIKQGLCHRPVTPAGKPILSRVPDSLLGGLDTKGDVGGGGVFVATGHGPWGISMSLGTGKVMAEMLLGEQTTTVDVSQLGLQYT